MNQSFKSKEDGEKYWFEMRSSSVAIKTKDTRPVVRFIFADKISWHGGGVCWNSIKMSKFPKDLMEYVDRCVRLASFE